MLDVFFFLVSTAAAKAFNRVAIIKYLLISSKFTTIRYDLGRSFEGEKIPFPSGVPRWHPQACHWLEEIPIFMAVHRKLFGFFVEEG